MVKLLSVTVAQVSQKLLQQITETVLQKTVDGMREEGTPYVGEYHLYSLFAAAAFIYFHLSFMPLSFRRAVRRPDADRAGPEGARV